MSELTKVAVDKVVSITGQKPGEVRNLLETGWTFTWDIRGNWSWTREGEATRSGNVMDGVLDTSKIGPLRP